MYTFSQLANVEASCNRFVHDKIADFQKLWYTLVLYTIYVCKSISIFRVRQGYIEQGNIAYIGFEQGYKAHFT